MKSLLFSLLVLVLAIGSAPAQVPRTISYQGILCDAAGLPKPDATYTVTFRLYTAESGGNLLWSEQKNLATKRGLFATRLGDQVLFGPEITFGAQYWLSIQVGADAELDPRIPLSAVGNSFRAVRSESAAYADMAVRATRSDTAAYAAVAGSGGSNPWQTSGGDIYYTSGSVGVGIQIPSSDLHVVGLDGVLFEGTSNSGAIPKQGGGTRMMWYPKKGAFRAGDAHTTEWDDVNIGFHSVGMGASTKAVGISSVALGWFTTASGASSTALGQETVASGDYSTAMGLSSSASGNYSTAVGLSATASGDYSTAIGSALGASGNNSTALGYNVFAEKTGGFIIGDHSPGNPTRVNRDNEFVAVFAGGYTLYTTRDVNQGVYINGGTSGWTNISDRNKKENFRAIDGEALLSKIRSLPITEWNYKGGDSSVRYVGPVAQDFYEAFRLGGTDSLGINSICIDGVNMAAVQALERRTAELKEKTAELEIVKAELADLKARLHRVEAALTTSRDFTQGVLTVSDEDARER